MGRVGRTLLVTGLIAGAMLGAPAAASAREQEMPAGEIAAAPQGYEEMCRATDLCAAAVASVDTRLSERQRTKLLRRINRRVNARTTWRDDVAESWRRPIGGRFAVGDCEDYAVEKRLELIAAGFPPDDLYFAVGYLHGIGLHAVLVARSAKGDVVLDSRNPWLTHWSRTPYVWLLRQTTFDPGVWRSASDASRPDPTKTLASLVAVQQNPA